MEPADNVELRADRHGHAHVVFAFPYRADIVDAVRAIPGRRFDWDAKEWWAPQADATAPYVKGVIERYPSLLVADDVRAWLARGRDGLGRPRGRPTRLDGRGAFVLETISGECPRSSSAEERGGRHWVPFSQAAAEMLLELRGARLDKRALRCATTAPGRPGSPPARRSRSSTASASRASRSTSTGIRTRSPPSSPCPRARRTAARSRSTRTSSSRSSTTCARTASRSAPNAARALERAADRARRRDRGRPPLARPRRAGRWRSRRVLGGELRPFQRAGVAYVLYAAADVPRRRAGPRQDGAGARRARGGRRLAGGRHLPRLAEAQLGAGDAALAPAPLARRRLRHRDRRARRRHHGRQLRHHPRAPRPARPAQAEGARARRVALREEPARQADAGGPPARGVAPAGRAPARAHRHAR